MGVSMVIQCTFSQAVEMPRKRVRDELPEPPHQPQVWFRHAPVALPAPVDLGALRQSCVFTRRILFVISAPLFFYHAIGLKKIEPSTA